MNCEEGEEYYLDDLPDSDMASSGALGMVGDGKLAAQFGDLYVTFEWGTVRCTDVTHKSEL